MKSAHTIEAPPKVKPAVDVEILSAISPATLEDSFVYVHCHYQSSSMDMLIRIWSTTFLIDKGSGSRSKLVHAENISFAPVWTRIPDSKEFSFLLIFEPLPKSCKSFDLVEIIAQPGGFEVRNIARNEADVYHIDLQQEAIKTFERLSSEKKYNVEEEIIAALSKGTALAIKLRGDERMIIVAIESFVRNAEIKTVKFKPISLYGHELDRKDVFLSEIEYLIPLHIEYDHPTYQKIRNVRKKYLQSN